MLTGGDFDIESVRQTPDGTFWFGEEFGPFIVHTDAKGRRARRARPAAARVMFARQPVPARPHAQPSAARTASRPWRCRADGRTLYPILEGAVIGDDPLVRHVYEFDVATRRYTGRTGSTG